MKNIKKINIIITFIFLISIIFSNYTLAVGSAFSEADSFLSARKSSIKYYKWGTITSNIKFYG